MIENIDSVDDFKTKISKKDKIFLVDFFATWCAPCSMMKDVIDDFLVDNPNISVIKVDVDKFESLALEYSVSSIPAIFAIKNGRILAKQIGACSKERLKSMVEEKC